MNSDLKAFLRELHITAVKEVSRASSCICIVITGQPRDKLIFLKDFRLIPYHCYYFLWIIDACTRWSVASCWDAFFFNQVEYSGKKAIVIFVPVPQLKAFQKQQPRLVRELEKKFSGKHVVFIAQRRILPKPTRKANKLKQKRPTSRTLTVSIDISWNINILWFHRV